jgi:hypothetical protein
MTPWVRAAIVALQHPPAAATAAMWTPLATMGTMPVMVAAVDGRLAPARTAVRRPTAHTARGLVQIAAMATIEEALPVLTVAAPEEVAAVRATMRLAVARALGRSDTRPLAQPVASALHKLIPYGHVSGGTLWQQD